MKKIDTKRFLAILLLLTIFSNNVFAQIVSLTCVSVNDKTFTMGIDFNEQQKYVVVSGDKVPATFNLHSIAFHLVVGDRNIKFFHLLNKSSGFMTVSVSGTNEIAQTFSCAVRNNKF